MQVYTIEKSFVDKLFVKQHIASRLYTCLHDQNKCGFFKGPDFIQPIRAIWKVFKKPWLAEKPVLQKSHLIWSCKQANNE